MSVTLADIGNAIVSALSVDLSIDGLPNYATTGRVLRGRYPVPVAGLPGMIAVASPAFASTVGPEIHAYERVLVWDVVAWAPVTAQSVDHRTLRGELLADRLMKALDDARVNQSSTLFQLRRMVVRGAVLDRDIEGLPFTMAGCVLQVETAHKRTRGA